MKLTIKRFDRYKQPQHIDMDYNVQGEGFTLLQALNVIKATIDPTLTFKSGCKSGICGTCSVRVNGKEQLACSCKVADGDVIEPLNYHQVKRDLVVDKSHSLDSLARAKAFLNSYQKADITIEEEKRIEVQSDCILCSSCFSACPVMAVNENFLGPFAMTRVYRYSVDKRESNPKEAIEAIQNSGVWDCTLCGECTIACPQGIDPKMDIMNLRGISTQYGYNDPNFANMSFGLDFSGGF
ncbi:MAG: succinate dehydrogenase/fumarate reductase iron-sulfur subunit [Campylobacterales bacterium]|nr:succinate dehydrogenase/fumarate reductase iron-sulfur subunit [Campylobacterales bacterium]